MSFRYILFWCACMGLVAISHEVEVQESGMTVLKVVYGASCGFGANAANDQTLLSDYVKALCDGQSFCNGTVDVDMLDRDIFQDCDGDFHAVAVCGHGEIRSISLEGESTGEEFILDCSERELPPHRQHPDWMSQMGEILSSRTVKQLRLAGTHHSGTSSFNMFLYYLARCQGLRVGQQLLAGVRYLDYRIGSVEDVYGARVVHGMFHGNLVFGELLEIWAFALLHPREFLIIDFQDTSTLGRRRRRQFAIWIHILFRDIAIQRWSVNIAHVTMQQMWDSKRRLLIVQDRPRSYLAWPRNVLHSRWPNLCSGEGLPEHAEGQLDQLDRHENKIVVLQWLITVQFRCLYSLYGRSIEIREDGLTWLRENGYPFNVFLTDFTLEPMNETGLIEELIEVNRAWGQ